jgi:DNA-3-methyladenine glycosylase II
MLTLTRDMNASDFEYRDGAIWITPPNEFHFDECMCYLARSDDECLHQISENKLYKLLRIEGEACLIEISCPMNKELRLQAIKPSSPHPALIEAAAKYVWEWLDLGRDLSPFYQMVTQDPVLKPILNAHYGLRLVGVPDLFEALCWSVIGQQINLPFAYKLKRRFVENFGTCMKWENTELWLFPEPNRIAALQVDDLRSLQFTQNKAQYIIGIANLMSEDILSKKKLESLLDFQAVEDELLTIRGVGRWTAHYVMMRCLRNPSAFPIQDAGIYQAAKRELKLDRKPSMEEVQQLFAHWSGWEAYAVFYLWASLTDSNHDRDKQ